MNGGGACVCGDGIEMSVTSTKRQSAASGLQSDDAIKRNGRSQLGAFQSWKKPQQGGGGGVEWKGAMDVEHKWRKRTWGPGFPQENQPTLVARRTQPTRKSAVITPFRLKTGFSTPRPPSALASEKNTWMLYSEKRTAFSERIRKQAHGRYTRGVACAHALSYLAHVVETLRDARDEEVGRLSRVELAQLSQQLRHARVVRSRRHQPQRLPTQNANHHKQSQQNKNKDHQRVVYTTESKKNKKTKGWREDVERNGTVRFESRSWDWKSSILHPARRQKQQQQKQQQQQQ